MLQLKYKAAMVIPFIKPGLWVLILIVGFAITLSAPLLNNEVLAQDIPAGCPGGPAGPPAPGTVCPEEPGPAGIERKESGEYECKDASIETCVKENPIVKSVINPLINLLAALVGVAVTLMIIVGGIQYGSSGGDPQAVANAKQKIKNAIIALLAFAFMWSFLQWIVPGGIF